MPLIDRLMARVQFEDGGCWTWTGPTLQGYGFMGGPEHRPMRVHRVSYEHFYGAAVPAGLEIDHLCRNRACVHPAHLEAVTHRVNMDRSIGKRTPKTHCPQGHEFSGENTYTNPRNGYRQCRSCVRDAGARYRDRIREAA